VLPEPIACLRCTFPRTLRVGDRRVCFQCRFSWHTRHPVVTPAAAPTWAQDRGAGYAFTPAEFARLTRYRAAVQAGFYSDSLQSPYRRTSQVSATRSWE
jgi:hypothetical protein